MPEHHGEYEALRERVAAALYRHGWPQTSEQEPWPGDGGVLARLCRSKADAVLADLRLSKVGRVTPDHDGYPMFSGTTPSTEDGNHVRDCTVYRLDAPSWDSRALAPSGSGGLQGEQS